MSIVFFDVETPNRLNDRICSIGVVRTDDDFNIELRREYLINPETCFDRVSSNVHGISSRDVLDASTFDDIWRRDLQNIFTGALVVAHNAIFDLTVLDKTLSYYGMKIPTTEYLCTLQAARYSELPCDDYKLPTLCSQFSIPLASHHNALADALACKELFVAMRNKGHIDMFCTSVFEHSNYTQESIASRPDKAAISSMTDLYGRTVGIGIDRIIKPEELTTLDEWMSRNDDKRNQPIYREAFHLIEKVVKDRIVTPEEHEILLNCARPFVANTINSEMQTLLGIIRGIAADEKINLAEATGLKRWLVHHKKLESDESYVRIFSLLEDVLDDEIITKEEETKLLSLLKKLAEPTQTGAIRSFEGKGFCLTGDFVCGSKNVVRAKIESKGGIIRSGVSRKCNYVIVGGCGSSDYLYGNYGTKVKRAMELQDQGYPIQILQETALLESLDDAS